MNDMFLLDDDFLAQLDNYKQRELWVKILALTLDENPVDEITGRVTGGSISVDGKSKLRRSCSINLLSDRLNINEYLWGLNTKIRISIGMKNTIDPVKYGDIVWFPQGTYVLNSFNISINNNSSNISIQGKDKMCLLSGDIGGNLTALSYAFDVVEEENGENSYYKRKLPLKYIIREAVHTYANEPYHNIIINDLDDYGFELLTYRGEEPMYLIYSLDEEDITNMTINPDQKYTFKGQTYTIAQLENLAEDDRFKFKVLNEFITQDVNSASIVQADGKDFQIIRITYGMTCGYRITDLIYPSELVLNANDGLTSMLDKLVSMLGNFEYFYNLDGQFIFQRKQTFVHQSWNTIVNNGEEQWVDNTAYSASHVYSLYNSKLISQFSNSPALNNVKNDYSIWGARKGATGIEMPIHMRYAIDKKPEYYKSISGKVYVTDKSVFDKLKSDAKESVLQTVIDRIQNFALQYPSVHGLPAPEKQANGSWSQGWWDIRDWHDYYYAITLTEPNYTMKWYSKNNLEGCVPASSLPIKYAYSMSKDSYVWLLIRRQDGTFNPQHGTGNPSNNGRTCTLYESYYGANSKLVTQPAKDTNGKGIQEYFIPPYSGCNDNHTYLEFLEGDVKTQGNTVYFYNPDFPAYDSFEDLVDTQIEKEFQEYLESGMLNLVDWREIIYQMAKDHNKYGNLDNANSAVQLVSAWDGKTNEKVILTKEALNAEPEKDRYSKVADISFLSAVRELNPLFYPTGYTGYEQYYIDMEGFWRQIYNPEYQGSYDIEPITRLDYEAVTEPDTLFYDAPVYQVCDKNTIWHDDITYYTKNENDKYVADTMLTELEFNQRKNSGIYYYIKSREIKPVEITSLDVDKNEIYYKIGDYDQTKLGSQLTDKTKKEYCRKVTETKRMLVFKLEPFHRAHVYNTYDRGIYKPVSKGILRSDYEGAPWFYYRNKSGIQTCCTSIGIADAKNRPEECWFANRKDIKITNPYILTTVNDDDSTTSKTIILENGSTTNTDLTAICQDIMRNPAYADESLNSKLDKIPWYFYYKVYKYEPLVRPREDFDPQGTYYIKSDIQEFNYAHDNPPYWKSDLLSNPESLIFWFDFLDTDGELNTYNVKRIGSRPKAVNDKDVKAIYFRETPEVLFLEPDEWEQYATGADAWKKPTGYAYAQLPKYLTHLFAISSQGKSTKDVLDEYLYQYSYCTENITVTALPIYHLEPNTRVLIRDDNSHIDGEYIINKLTIPLDTKGSMTINAVKAIDRLY